MKIINHIAKVDNEFEFNEALSKTTIPRWFYTEDQIKDLNKDKFIGVEFDILSLEELDSLKHLNKDVFEQAKKLYHQKCQTSSTEGVLLGIQATEEDLYWILLNSDNKILYDTCVDDIKKV